MTTTAELQPDTPFSLGAAAAFGEPRLASYVPHFYGAGPAPASPEELARVAENWRPFRTWAAVLIRAAGDRAGPASLARAA
jgi:DNA-3-methyladenine glycosylase II